MVTKVYVETGPASKVSVYTADEMDRQIANAVPNTRTVNAKALSSNIVLTPDDLDDAATTHKFVLAADVIKLSNLSNTNSGDQTLVGLGATATVAELNILDGATLTVTELNYVDGVTSSIQTQLNAKQATLTGLTATAAELNALDGITATVAELNYIDGVTSAIQTQLDGKAALAQTMYIGTTAHDINRASAAEGLAGITSLVPGADFTLAQNSVNVLTLENAGAIANTLYLKAGNVGIGTTSPGAKLEVDGPIASGINVSAIFRGGADNNTSGPAINFQAGYTGATWYPAQIGVITTGFGANWASALTFSTNSGSTPTSLTEAMRILANGNVGIGTTGPSSVLDVVGTVQFASFGAGAATFDASGNISSVSDERMKNIQGNFTAGLKEVLQINPILYKYNELSGLEMENTYAGFSAQNVMKYIPEAVGKNLEGYYSFNDRPVIAALVNSIKELSGEIVELRKKVNLPTKDFSVVALENEERCVISKVEILPEKIAKTLNRA